LAKINSVSKMEGSRFDLVALIQTTNALQAAGKEGAVAALRAYLPSHGSEDWRTSFQRELDPVHLILRLLFTARDKDHPLPPIRKGVSNGLPDDLLHGSQHFPSY
jgi:hypothetical protein